MTDHQQFTLILAGLLIMVFILPYTVFLCVKLGTFAFFLGRKRFKEREEDDDKKNRKA